MINLITSLSSVPKRVKLGLEAIRTTRGGSGNVRINDNTELKIKTSLNGHVHGPLDTLRV